jgi:hypothetical protein
MVYFQTKNSYFGILRRALDWKMLAYFMTLWNVVMSFAMYILSPFGTACGHFVHFSHFGMFEQRTIWQPR